MQVGSYGALFPAMPRRRCTPGMDSLEIGFSFSLHAHRDRACSEVRAYDGAMNARRVFSVGNLGESSCNLSADHATERLLR